MTDLDVVGNPKVHGKFIVRLLAETVNFLSAYPPNTYPYLAKKTY